MAFLDWLFGRPLATAEEEEQRVGVAAGIPMLGLDALASAAYGPEAALTILIVLGAAGVGLIGPITLVIVSLLFLVYLSYRQTIAAYPNGGGSYTVAKENLGVWPGLLAAAALMIDYVLTVAVGISAGVGALVSAIPELQHYTLRLCLLILAIITLINLRGVRESGLAFAFPTYLFIVSMFGVLIAGIWKAWISDGHPTAVQPVREMSEATETMSLWLLAKAFASGCTAMTGVEAVSNGVAAFRDPPVKNARRTLTAIIALLAAMLLGIGYLCKVYGVGATEPGTNEYESVLSQLIAAIAGRGVVYYVTIASVLAVLCLSANTGFADFPRLCRAVSHDGFLPHGFGHRGRRLVYTEGITVLAMLSAVLLVAFGGVTDNLIPLYAVGAFLAFTLSQAGMVAHWFRVRGAGWKVSVLINGIGGLGTLIALLVVLVAKFLDGAWLTVVLIGGLVVSFAAVRRHYRDIAREVASGEPIDTRNLVAPLVVVLVRGWSRVTARAVRLALEISKDVYALHVAADELQLQTLEDEWAKYVIDPCTEAKLPPPKLVVITSPFRRLYAPLIEFLTDLERSHPDRDITVMIPELVERRWYHYILHNQTAAILKGYLYFSGLERVSVLNVPWYLKGDGQTPKTDATQP
jgi:amino acid transporter